MSGKKDVNLAAIGQVFADVVVSPNRQLKQRLDVERLHGFKKYTKDGVTFDIHGNEDVLNSIITDKYWNISEIDKRPIPEAYFEVKFNEIDQQNSNYSKQYGIGIGNQIFNSEELLGAQKNSFGYLNDGSVWANGKEIQRLKPFSPGMTVGAGILLDSYNQQRLYFTLDGKLVGTMNATVHTGMDCFPGVTFERTGAVSFTANLSEKPFLFDAKSLPNFRGDMTNRFARLPKEIQLSCMLYAASGVGHHAVVELRRVNKAFAAEMLENQIWRSLFVKRWPTQNRNIKFKSWYKMFINRHKIEKVNLAPIFIENCEMEFDCPMVGSNLKDMDNYDEKFCAKCQKTVYEVNNQATLKSYTEMGRCVMFKPRNRDHEVVRGKVRYDPVRIPEPK